MSQLLQIVSSLTLYSFIGFCDIRRILFDVLTHKQAWKLLLTKAKKRFTFPRIQENGHSAALLSVAISNDASNCRVELSYRSVHFIKQSFHFNFSTSHRANLHLFALIFISNTKNNSAKISCCGSCLSCFSYL